MVPLPTRVEVEELLGRIKSITQDISWTVRPGTDAARQYFSVPVNSPGFQGSLELRGTVGPSHWSFALLMNRYPIRRSDYQQTPHCNPDGGVIRAPHKHDWDEQHRDGHAFIPNDIDFSDINEAFQDFLAECAIQLQATYHPLV